MKTFKQISRLIVAVCAFSLIFISCKKSNSENTLLNTEWTGLVRIPEESQVVLKFSQDKLDLLFENKVIETMKYSLKDNHLILEKTAGRSPCEIGVKGDYNYEVIGDNLAISLISDNCPARSASLKKNIFTKISSKK